MQITEIVFQEVDLSTGVSCYKYLRVQALTSTLQCEVGNIKRLSHFYTNTYYYDYFLSSYNNVHFLLDDT